MKNYIEIPFQFVKPIENGNSLSILTINSSGKQEYILIYKFLVKGKEDYAVIGKFKEEYIPTFHDEGLVKWLGHLQAFLSNKDILSDYKEFIYEARFIKNSRIIKELLLTQEGYDLITGKFFFTNFGIIQKTVMLDTYLEESENYFTNEGCTMINKEGKVAGLALFDKVENYDERYFLNRKDVAYFSGESNSLLYAMLNKNRIYQYLNKYYNDWFKSHYFAFHENDPMIQAEIGLQLLDVVTDFQIEEQKNNNRVLRRF